MAVPTALEGTPGIVLLLGRVLFGDVLAFMGLNHFVRTDELAAHAESQDLPAPRTGVLVSGAMLVAGGLSIAIGVYPTIGAALIVFFLIVATPLMHDFWTRDDPATKQAEMVNFLKNVAILGAATVFVVLTVFDWPYAAEIGI